MDRPTTRHQDTDDSDFENDEKMDNQNECSKCDNYKNANRKYCDSCMYSQGL